MYIHIHIHIHVIYIYIHRQTNYVCMCIYVYNCVYIHSSVFTTYGAGRRPEDNKSIDYVSIVHFASCKPLKLLYVQ